MVVQYGYGLGLKLQQGFGCRESFGLQGQGLRVWAGVLGRGCLKIDHQQTGQPPKKIPQPKKRINSATRFLGTGSNKEKYALNWAHWIKRASTLRTS